MSDDDIIEATLTAIELGGAVFVVRPDKDTYRVTVLAKGVHIQEALDAVVEAVETTDGVPSPYCG